MANTKTMTEKLIVEFTENYMENLFYFCLKKTGNSTEAEDLAQDITLNILPALADKAKAQLAKLYQTITELVKKDLPEDFSEGAIPYNHAVSECCSLRGYLVAEALRQGYLSPIEGKAQSIGAHLDLL